MPDGALDMDQGASESSGNMPAGGDELRSASGPARPGAHDPWQALRASGRVSAPSAEADVLDEPPADFGIDASAELARLRDDER